jgi:hypothetical protein
MPRDVPTERFAVTALATVIRQTSDLVLDCRPP